MPIFILLLPLRDVLHLATTNIDILKQACCLMFHLTQTIHVCLNCKTIGNDVWAFCNLCHFQMCRPGHAMPSLHRPRRFTTTFENDWHRHANGRGTFIGIWKPHVLTTLSHFWCLIRDIRETQMLHQDMQFVTAVTITLTRGAESLNPGYRPHTRHEPPEYSDTSSEF